MEVERVFALRGKSSSGKTSSLNRLIDLLDKIGDRLEPIQKVGSNDHIGIFRVNNRVIGVTTQGDNKKQVEKGLNKLAGKCNIIFCATRTRQGTRNHVIERFGNKITWIEALGVKNQKAHKYDNSSVFDKRNNFVAEILLNLIPA